MHKSYSEAYAAAAGIGEKLDNASQHQALPQFPGEDSLKHISEKWIETSVARLAGCGLLSVARGGMTPESRWSWLRLGVVAMSTLPSRTHAQLHAERDAVADSSDQDYARKAENVDRGPHLWSILWT